MKWNETMNRIPRWMPVIVWGLWSAVFGWLLLEYRYTTYIQKDFWWLLVIGSVITLLFFLSGMSQSNETKVKNGWATILHGLIILFPIMVLVSIEGKELNSYAMQQRMVGPVGMIADTAAVASPSTGPLSLKKPALTPTPSYSNYQNQLAQRQHVAQEQQQPEEPITCTLLDLTRHPTYYSNKEVLLRTMIYKGENVPDDYTALFQFMLICCAADARPIAVLVDLKKVSAVDKEKWVETTGLFKMITVEGNPAYYIDVQTIKNIADPPRYERYLYF